MPSKKILKPCDIPCPKCGSEDIYRKYFKKGSEHKAINNFDEEFNRNNEFVEVTQWTVKVKKECITHHCRVCGYEWETLPYKGKIK